MNDKEFIEYFKELCNKVGDICNSSSGCETCILNKCYKDYDTMDFCDIFPDTERSWNSLFSIIESIRNWNKGKTYKEDFLEKFPDAETHGDKFTPYACRNFLYKDKQEKCIYKLADGYSDCINCIDCWNEKLPDNNEVDNKKGD